MTALKRTIVSIVVSLCILGILASILCTALIRPNLKSFNNTDMTINTGAIKVYNGTDIWLADQGEFNYLVCSDLINKLSGGAGYSAMIGETLTANDIRTRNNGKSIVLTMGGYDWIATYVSQSTNQDSDMIVTLYMADSDEKSTFGSSTSNYGSNSNSGYPTAMYGTSYLRTQTLNNTGNYLNVNANWWNPTSSNNKYTATDTHKYATFTYSGSALTKYIVTPAYVTWQESGQTAVNRGENYMLSNENWSKDISNTGFSGNNAQYNFANKEGSDAWKDDFLWLPSLSETGLNNANPGIWQLSVQERSNSNGNAWVRSARENDTTYVRHLYASGDGAYYSRVSTSNAVRPALHLNLTEVFKAIPYTLTADANGGSIVATDNWTGIGTIATKLVVMERGYGNLPNITAPYGYSFEGWFSASTGGVEVSDTTIMPAHDVRIYAQWSPIPYQVNFSSEDTIKGTVLFSNDIINYRSNAINGAFAKDGYMFAYWLKTDYTGTKKVFSNPLDDMILGETTYVAYFTKTFEFSCSVVAVENNNGNWVKAEIEDNVVVGMVNMLGYARNDVDYIHFSATACSGYKFVGFGLFDPQNMAYTIIISKQDEYDNTADILASSIRHQVVYACFVKNS